MSTEPDPIPAARDADSEVSLGYSYYVLGILFTVYVFNFIDRQVLAILLEPIKQELQASDTAMGFLVGFTFVVFYTFAGIPIARWADRTSRRSVIALGLVVWSAMTAASGLTRSFAQLALARIGVGIGEAAGSPPAHSLLSDYFPPERRATALSIYATGVYIGAMIAFMAGGYIREHFGWRLVFLLVGLPGIPLALLVRMTVRELPRGFSESGPADTREVSLAEVIRFLLSRRSFLYIAAGASCQSLGGYAILSWGPAFLERVHLLGVVEVGTWLGLCVGIGGAAGAYLGGKLADRLGARDPSWYMRLPAIQAVLGVPFVAGFLLIGRTELALLSFFPYYFVANMYIGPMLAMTQGIVKLRMRATASAILLFILNMVGLGAGSFVVGLLNDQLAPRFGIEAIRYSLLAVAMMGVPASFCFLQASRTLYEDLRARET